MLLWVFLLLFPHFSHFSICEMNQKQGSEYYFPSAAEAEISSYVRPSPYASAEKEEKEGEDAIVLFFPGI